MDYLRSEGKIYNDSDFCKKIGKNRTAVSECANGRRPVTKYLAEAVVNVFPEVNPDWLIYESCTSMLRDGSSPSVITSAKNSNVNNGHDQTIGSTDSAALLKTIQEQQRTIDRLLTIIERMQS